MKKLVTVLCLFFSVLFSSFCQDTGYKLRVFAGAASEINFGGIPAYLPLTPGFALETTFIDSKVGIGISMNYFYYSDYPHDGGILHYIPLTLFMCYRIKSTPFVIEPKAGIGGTLGYVSGGAEDSYFGFNPGFMAGADFYWLFSESSGLSLKPCLRFTFEEEIMISSINVSVGYCHTFHIQKPDKRSQPADLSEDKDAENIKIRKGEKSITLVLDNIHFAADSSELVLSEKKKLDKIIKLLKKYPNGNLLVEGYCADIKSDMDTIVLSKLRAVAVAEYLVLCGARSREQVKAVGRGVENPIASNRTEKGRNRNRRVEITILEEEEEPLRKGQKR